MQELATSLTDDFGRGFSRRNLEYMRKFYLTYRDREPQIAQTVSAQLPMPPRDQPQAELEAADIVCVFHPELVALRLPDLGR